MHSQNSALVLALCLLIAIVALLGGRLLFLEYSRDARGVGSTVDVPSDRQPLGGGNSSSRVSPHMLARANDRLREMEETLSTNSTLLAERTAKLKRSEAEVGKLKRDLDQAIAFAVNTISKEGIESDASSERSPRDQLATEAVEARLAEMVALQQAQAARISELEQTVRETETELMDLRTAAEQEIVALMTEQEALAGAARATLAELGQIAVPSLVEKLRDPRATVRAWAATALGEIGLDAASATPPLADLLLDESEQVRNAARRALDAIEP